VVGTGDPDIDVPAVQAAVDHGGQVVLRGHFSFERPPTTPAGATFRRMVTVSNAVVLSGNRDEDDALPTIDGGVIPFAVEAPGSPVAMQGLHFVRPQGGAIWIVAVSGLVIADTRIEGAEPFEFAMGARPLCFPITVIPHGLIGAQQSQSENVSGTLSIANNDIDIAGTAGDQTEAISVFNVGISPDKEVDLDILGNHLRNSTERVISINTIVGRVHIAQNVITTGPFAMPVPPGVPRPNAIHTIVAGSTVIAHNAIRSAWATGSGILVHGTPGLAEAGAIVVDNEVTMVAPEGTVFGAHSAGIEILGFAQHNVVLQNRIRGRGSAALAVVDEDAGMPGNTTFVLNDLTRFQSALADVVIDAGVTNTLIVGRQRSVVDHGVGTVIVPVP
jgi:hypothetical protein